MSQYQTRTTKEMQPLDRTRNSVGVPIVRKQTEDFRSDSISITGSQLSESRSRVSGTIGRGKQKLKFEVK
jgi:hypothetical protein